MVELTEQEWLECSNYERMVFFLLRNESIRPSARKQILIACAGCRLIWELLSDERSRRAVDVAELWADDRASRVELEVAARAAEECARPMSLTHTPHEHAAYAALGAASAAAITARYGAADCWANKDYSYLVNFSIRLDLIGVMSDVAETRFLLRNAMAHFLRDITGPRPFRPVPLDATWLTSTVVSLAEVIYAERAFDRLSILADALEDAGCDNADILDHCRGPGPQPVETDARLR
jgi:hypothetical protein